MEQNKEKNNIIAFLDHSKKARILALIVLGVISLSTKMLFFPSDLPFMGDALGYFWYANDMSILNDFPGWEKDRFPNTLWPTLLSGFFSIINSNNFIDYIEKNLSYFI